MDKNPLKTVFTLVITQNKIGSKSQSKITFLNIKLLPLLLFMFVSFFSFSQSGIDTDPVNSIELNTQLEKYHDQIYLITGEESIYQQHEWLKASLMKNIENGIREGNYIKEGSLCDIDGLRASKTTLIFYNHELYKVRWLFRKEDHPDLNALSNDINNFFITKYGKVSEKGFLGMQIWHGKKNYLQTFLEENEFQIEYRDDKIHEIVEALD